MLRMRRVLSPFLARLARVDFRPSWQPTSKLPVTQGKIAVYGDVIGQLEGVRAASHSCVGPADVT